MNYKDKNQCMMLDGDMLEYQNKIYKAYLDKDNLRLESKDEVVILEYPQNGIFYDLEQSIKAFSLDNVSLFEE